ncbi:MAG TPA: phosphatase PAP2 family protein [Microbacteriaceae bacterium]|jgi:undecaprenyl-diphosphatase|nr:phosphatase PAP2 family protein [Microbacteriaceae bacterium]
MTIGETATARRIARFWPVVSASVAVVLVIAVGALIAFRPSEPFALDVRWMNEVIEHREPYWTIPALVMDFLGGGLFGVVIVPTCTILALLLFRRPWGALYYALAAALSAGVVQALKLTVGRARPEDILVHSDLGSFPSGHTANAATIAVTLGIIFLRTWVWAAGAVYTVLMLLSRTYLGAHWLSDTAGGLLLGAGLAVVVWAPFAYKVLAERSRPHRFVLAR